MSLFYKPTPDLKPVYDLAMRVGQEIAIRFNGYGTPGYLEEMLPELAAAMQSSRDRLISEGRTKDLKSFRKYVLSGGSFMDNACFNRQFLPFVDEHLKR